MATRYPGYSSVWPLETACVAEILMQNGYATAAFGKWHNTPAWEASPAGPFRRWPTGLGFERFYGFLGGDTDQFSPMLVDGTRPVEPPAGPDDGYHLDADLADQAVGWLRSVSSVAPERPFFLYFAPGTAHAPHHAPRATLEQFRGVFDHGWDRQRELTFARQRELGVVPAETILTPRPAEIPAWDSLSPEERLLAARLQEAFAAALAHCDFQIGRVLAELQQLGRFENTLVIYLAGDNGPSGEGTLTGQVIKWGFLNGVPEDLPAALARLDDIGGPLTYNNYPVGWGWAGSSPLQWLKQVASHFGATRNGMVVSWPARIADPGSHRTQFHHCIDIVPTILAAAGIPEPEMVNGVSQRPMDGISMLYAFDDPDEPSRRRTQYFEMLGHRALYQDGWTASARHGRLPWQLVGDNPGDFDGDRWELYQVENDFSQARDLADEHPEKLRQLQDMWWAEAARNQVLPLDDRFAERLSGSAGPSAEHRYVYQSGVSHIPEGLAPKVKGRSHTISADVSIPEGGADGILVAAGGRFGGYALYVRDDRFHYVHNLCGVRLYTVSSDATIASGRHTLAMRFDVDREELGSGGTVSLTLNGQPIGQAHVERTVPYLYSFTETLDVGRDTGTPVDNSYCPPFTFTGELHELTFDIHTDISPREEELHSAEVARIERATD